MHFSGLLLFMVCLQMPVIQDSLREEIPIMIDYEKQLTPYIIVTVNKKKVKAVFDTGSSGLRILSGAMSNGRSDSVPPRVRYTYGRGAEAFGIEGRVFSESIRFGRLEAPYPVKIMRIDSTRYGHLAGWTSTGDSAVIASAHFRDCPAIIGVGLRARKSLKGIVNPLAQLPGNGKFIVEFPAYGEKTGRLIINPLPEDEQGFTLFQLKPGKEPLSQQFGSWLDDDLNGCIYINKIAFCHPTLLDSGAPDTQISSRDVTGTVAVPPGDIIMKVSDGFNPWKMVDTRLNTPDKMVPHETFVKLTSTDKGEKDIFGVRTFFTFDVLYDLQNGYIGLKLK